MDNQDPNNPLSNILNLPMDDLEPGHSEEALAALNKAKQDQYDICRAFKRVFGSKEGKNVLADLRAKTVDGPTWNWNMRAEDATINGFAREGQNSIFRYIEEKMATADTLKEELDQQR